MTWVGRYRRMVLSGPEVLLERILLWGLYPLGLIYGIITQCRTWLYRSGFKTSYRASVPVVSVGNIAVGGTGKTPVVDYLVKRLLARGLKVAVVSRGYGGSLNAPLGVVSAGQGPQMIAEVCGDEPFLLAQRNPQAIVVVSPRRADGIRVAVDRYGAQIVILDDGFQHLAVQRDLDIVLVDARNPLGNRRVLPAGILREFPRSLNRADLVIFTRSEERCPQDIPFSGLAICSRHVLENTALGLDGSKVSLDTLSEKRGVAFAGIAEPGHFFSGLRQARLQLSKTLEFPDHVDYDEESLKQLVDAAGDADYLVTTEKDGVKLDPSRFPVPCYQIPLRLDIDQQDILLDKLQRLIDGDSMTLKKELLDILACPQCKGELRYEEEGNRLLCEACRLAYPVRDEIPVMLIDEAQSF